MPSNKKKYSPSRRNKDKKDSDPKSPPKNKAKKDNNKPMDGVSAQPDPLADDLFGDIQSLIPNDPPVQTTEVTIQAPKKKLPRRRFRWRYDTRFMVNEANDNSSPQDKVTEAIQQLFSHILECDKSAVLLPYRRADIEDYDAITDPSKIPFTNKGVKAYVPRAFYPKDGGMVYSPIYIAHNNHIDSFIDAAKDNMRGTNFGVYARKLQCERTKICGWVKHTLPSMDCELWSCVISASIGTTIGVRCRPVATGLGGTTPEEQRSWALHLEINEDEYYAYIDAIRELWNKNHPERWPLGVRGKWIPTKENIRRQEDIPRADQARESQRRFVQAVKYIYTNDFFNPDHKLFKNREVTLRHVLMSIPSKYKQGSQLFHSIDRLDPRGWSIAVIPKRYQEAQNIVYGLLTFLVNWKPVAADAFRAAFTKEARLRENYMSWDETNQEIITDDDKFFAANYEDSDDDYNLDENSHAQAESDAEMSNITGYSTDDSIFDFNTPDISMQEDSDDAEEEETETPVDTEEKRQFDALISQMHTTASQRQAAIDKEMVWKCLNEQIKFDQLTAEQQDICLQLQEQLVEQRRQQKTNYPNPQHRQGTLQSTTQPGQHTPIPAPNNQGHTQSSTPASSLQAAASVTPANSLISPNLSAAAQAALLKFQQHQQQQASQQAANASLANRQDYTSINSPQDAGGGGPASGGGS